MEMRDAQVAAPPPTTRREDDRRLARGMCVVGAASFGLLVIVCCLTAFEDAKAETEWKSVDSSLRTAELTRITAQDAHIVQLKKIIATTDKEVHVIAVSMAKKTQKIADLRRQMSQSKVKEELEIHELRKDYGKKKRLLKEARIQDADEPLLQKEVVQDQLWKKLSKASAKLHAAKAKEEEKALARKVHALKADLEHRNDDAVQKLKDELAAKDAALKMAKAKPIKNKQKAHKAAVIQAETDLRNEVTLLTSKNNKLHADETQALEAATKAKDKEAAIIKHDKEVKKQVEKAILKKQIEDLKRGGQSQYTYG